MNCLVFVIIVSLCVSAVSFTISVTSIFKWFRELVSKINSKIEELIHCPWCLSHWILFFLMIFIYEDFPIIVSNIFFNFVIVYFAIIGLSGIFHFILLRTYKPIAESEVQRKLEKLNKI